VTDIIKNAKKVLFSRLFSGFHFWTFLKMSKIHFPFDFLIKRCDCDGGKLNRNIFVTFYGKRNNETKLLQYFRNICFQNISVILFYVLAFKLKIYLY
jgi:hypothetical protein